MTDDKPKTLGQLNGWQVPMFRLNLIALPLLLPSVLTMGGFIVKGQHATDNRLSVIESQLISMASKDSITVQLLELRRQILEEIASRYPPQSLLEAVRENRADIKSLLGVLRSRVPEFSRGNDEELDSIDKE